LFYYNCSVANLLYSSAAIRFFDYTQHVTANQWYWNYDSTQVVPTPVLPTYFVNHFSKITCLKMSPYVNKMNHLAPFYHEANADI